MQTYLGLLQWTKEGVEKIKDSPSRLDAAKKAFEAAGGKITSVFMLMGQYDLAVIAEAPDDATMARVILSLASKGGIRTVPLLRMSIGKLSRASPDCGERPFFSRHSNTCLASVCPKIARQTVRFS